MADKETVDAIIDAIQMEHQVTPPANPGAGLSRYFLDNVGEAQLRRSNGDIDPVAGAGGSPPDAVWCRVQRPTDQTVVADVWTLMNWTDEIEASGQLDLGDDEFTADQDGHYLVYAQIGKRTTVPGVGIQLWLNDALEMEASPRRTKQADGWVNAMWQISLSIDDTLKVYGKNTGDTILRGSATVPMEFSIWRLFS